MSCVTSRDIWHRKQAPTNVRFSVTHNDLQWSLRFRALCTYLQSIKVIWDLQFKAGFELLSEEVLLGRDTIPWFAIALAEGSARHYKVQTLFLPTAGIEAKFRSHYHYLGRAFYLKFIQDLYVRDKPRTLLSANHINFLFCLPVDIQKIKHYLLPILLKLIHVLFLLARR